MRGHYAGSLMGAAWTPKRIASLYAWYNPDKQTEGNLGAITTMVDQSGNGRDFTQTNAGNKPHLRTSYTNGRNVIQIGETTAGAATTTYMDIASSFLSGVSAAHMFYVAKAYADPAIGGNDGAVFSNMENHSGDTHIPYSDGNIYTGFCSSTRRSANPYMELSQWFIFEEWSAANDYGVRINGHDIITSATNTVSLANNVRKFGVSDLANTGEFRGQFAEGIFFNAKLSSTDSLIVRNYLVKRFGLSASLPMGDASKTYPAATHWRIRAMTTNGTNNAYGMRELQMYASTDGTGTNLAVLTGGNSAIASHNDGSYPKENAFNDNTSDFWTSLGVVPPTGGHWIGVQFASPVSIGSFRVYPRGDFNESPTSYSLEYSLDSGSTWLTMKAGGAITGNTWTVIPT